MSAPDIERETARQVALRMLKTNGARLVQAVDQEWQSIADAIEENVKASYLARQSQEPNEAEIEMVARAICASYPGYPDPDHDDGTCWQYHVIDARAAIRAIRGLDEGKTSNG